MSPAPKRIVWDHLATGESGDIEIERAFLRMQGELYATFCRKQHDYGRGNIAKFGDMGVLVRVSDKVERLINLARREAPANESIDDSWLDIATYGVIAMLCRRGEWGAVARESTQGPDRPQSSALARAGRFARPSGTPGQGEAMSRLDNERTWKIVIPGWTDDGNYANCPEWSGARDVSVSHGVVHFTTADDELAMVGGTWYAVREPAPQTPEGA